MHILDQERKMAIFEICMKQKHWKTGQSLLFVDILIRILALSRLLCPKAVYVAPFDKKSKELSQK